MRQLVEIGNELINLAKKSDGSIISFNKNFIKDIEKLDKELEESWMKKKDKLYSSLILWQLNQEKSIKMVFRFKFQKNLKSIDYINLEQIQK